MRGKNGQKTQLKTSVKKMRIKQKQEFNQQILFQEMVVDRLKNSTKVIFQEMRSKIEERT